ncbi:HNH endonuclease [Dethiosulfovibrio salsuginis]|uniref:HNH endonuclease n=1 Tax=Dethiosulfovibrio salsuginis TaxID=561720 RepID=A0A1X7IR22_9BACT|nr:HNH endonuclease [Dethiosulfovibrio salsuginis]SMG17188.1 HNH endonuclease [Dethiosulfovibrio salsuginis]
MRPVVRGKRPQSSKGFIEFKTYGDAKIYLIGRLGEYCSYCEVELESCLAVEHVLPKKTAVISADEMKRRELDWNNFLLACSNCNSTKSNQETPRDDCLWPDRDNTFRAIEYSEGGLVSPNKKMPPDIIEKAKRLIHLVGLDKIPTANNGKSTDLRWLHRKDIWDIATEKREQLKEIDQKSIDIFKKFLIDIAKKSGYWSIWMTVFRDDEDICRQLTEAFPGTCNDCFSDHMEPIQRKNGLC